VSETSVQVSRSGMAAYYRHEILVPMGEAAAEMARLTGDGWSVDRVTPCPGSYLTSGLYRQFQGGRLNFSPGLKHDDWFVILSADEPAAAPPAPPR
jgi:hypothetical protein